MMMEIHYTSPSLYPNEQGTLDRNSHSLDAGGFWLAVLQCGRAFEVVESVQDSIEIHLGGIDIRKTTGVKQGRP